ncbi:LuxR C-terminal-related transcriptional regulator [Candidatus Nitrospira nitrosa]
MEVLWLLGQCKTVSAIGAETTLSVKTVNTYRTRHPSKLDLRTTAELIHYGIEHHQTT